MHNDACVYSGEEVRLNCTLYSTSNRFSNWYGGQYSQMLTITLTVSMLEEDILSNVLYGVDND